MDSINDIYKLILHVNYMKLKDIVGRVKNHSNGQTNLNIKKKKLKELNISEEDFLDMDMKFLLRDK